MKTYTVYYNKQANMNVTYYCNESRVTGSRAFHSLEDATAFAGTVPAARIYDNTGKRCK